MVRASGKTYTVILQEETDLDFEGYFNVSVPALPGCFTYGKNREEALTNVREAIELYLEDLEDAGEPLPEEKIETVGVSV